MLKGCCLEESLLTILSELSSSTLFEGVLQPRGQVFHAHSQLFWSAWQCNKPKPLSSPSLKLPVFLCRFTDFLSSCSETWKRWSQNQFDLMRGNMAKSDIHGCSTPSMLFPCLNKVSRKRRKISNQSEFRLTNKIKLNWILFSEIIYCSPLV